MQSTRNVRRRHDDAIGRFLGVGICIERPAALPFFVPTALDGSMVVGFRDLLAQGVFRRSLLRRRSTSGSLLQATAEHLLSPYRRRRRTWSRPSGSGARKYLVEGPSPVCSLGRGPPSP